MNRIVELTEAGIQYEADPWHVDLIIEELGLENANGSDVTGSEVDINETDAELDREESAGEILAEAPREVLWFAWQGVESNLQVYVDTDYAGCPRTRRSTNGGLVMHGSHLLKDLGFDTDRGGTLER